MSPRQPALLVRLALAGPDALGDPELLAVACGLSIDDAQRLLSPGMGPPRRALGRRWQALLALFRRLDTTARARRPTVSGARSAAELLRPRLAHAEVEELHVLALDTRNRVLGCAQVAKGAVNQVGVAAREVFRPLIALGAARAIVAHNHPSGDPAPSEADRELTVRLGIAGELLGIAVLDHLVIATDGYFSFAEDEGMALRGTGRARTDGRATATKGQRARNVGQGIGIG